MDIPKETITVKSINGMNNYYQASCTFITPKHTEAIATGFGNTERLAVLNCNANIESIKRLSE